MSTTDASLEAAVMRHARSRAAEQRRRMTVWQLTGREVYRVWPEDAGPLPSDWVVIARMDPPEPSVGR